LHRHSVLHQSQKVSLPKIFSNGGNRFSFLANLLDFARFCRSGGVGSDAGTCIPVLGICVAQVYDLVV